MNLLTSVQVSNYPLYLLIDEYDNFANEVMMQTFAGKEEYDALVKGEGPLKTLFKTVKSASDEGKLDRIFITGVSPVVMSDLTSGFNISESISDFPGSKWLLFLW